MSIFSPYPRFVILTIIDSNCCGASTTLHYGCGSLFNMCRLYLFTSSNAKPTQIRRRIVEVNLRLLLLLFLSSANLGSHFVRYTLEQGSFSIGIFYYRMICHVRSGFKLILNNEVVKCLCNSYINVVVIDLISNDCLSRSLGHMTQQKTWI